MHLIKRKGILKMCDDDLWISTTLSWLEWVLYVFDALRRSTGVDIEIYEGDDLDNYYYVDFVCKYFNMGICRRHLRYRDDTKEDYGFDGNICMTIEYYHIREGWEQVIKFLRLLTEERKEDFLWLYNYTIILKKQGEEFYTEATEEYQKRYWEAQYPFELLGPYYEKLIVKED